MIEAVRAMAKRSRRERARAETSQRSRPVREGEVVVVDADGRVALRTSRRRINEALNKAIATRDHG